MSIMTHSEAASDFPNPRTSLAIYKLVSSYPPTLAPCKYLFAHDQVDKSVAFLHIGLEGKIVASWCLSPTRAVPLMCPPNAAPLVFLSEGRPQSTDLSREASWPIQSHSYPHLRTKAGSSNKEEGNCTDFPCLSHNEHHYQPKILTIKRTILLLVQ